MCGNRHTAGPQTISFEAFGVAVTVNVDRGVPWQQVETRLPPGFKTIEPSPHNAVFVLERDGDGYRVGRADEHGHAPSLEVALELLKTGVRTHVAVNAPDLIFVHAGVVGHRGRAIVIPGPSGAGKTTLTAALVRAGAAYYSDEFAVLDADGRVHPYAKPLSIRGDAGDFQTDRPVHAFGGKPGEAALAVGLVVITNYEPGARWRPRRLTSGEAVLAMLSHALPARARPDQTIAAITRAASGAVTIESHRGESDDLAAQLLERVATACDSLANFPGVGGRYQGL